MSARRKHGVHGNAGCIQMRRARSTGTMVGVYDSLQAGMETDPSAAWMTVCEEHSSCVGHRTRKLALSHAAEPEGWCEDCREKIDREVGEITEVLVDGMSREQIAAFAERGEKEGSK